MFYRWNIKIKYTEIGNTKYTFDISIIDTTFIREIILYEKNINDRVIKKTVIKKGIFNNQIMDIKIKDNENILILINGRILIIMIKKY